MTKQKSGSRFTAATIRLVLPGRQSRSVGVFLLDRPYDKLEWRLISDWHAYADEDDVEVLQLLDETLQVQAKEIGGGRLFDQIADMWSNSLVIADEQDVDVQNSEAEIGRLFKERVESE